MSRGKGEGKGFRGLDDLVSDVSQELRVAQREVKAVETAPSKEKSTDQPAEKAIKLPDPPSDASAVKWVLGILAALGFVWLLAEGTNKQQPIVSSPENPVQWTPTQGSHVPTAPSETQVVTPPKREVSRSANASIVEKPPMGQGLVFSEPQIRYCVTEQIRLDAIEALVDNTSAAHVGRYNASVADYNSRCSNFRYRSGALQRVQADTAARRATIEREAVLDWVRSM